MRDKLFKLVQSSKEPCDNGFCPYESDDVYPCFKCEAESLVDHLIANGVTVQTMPISYERLLELAMKMHCWIFLHCADEKAVYDQLGLTEEENYVFGYGGKIEVPMPEAPKEGK